MNLFRTEFSVVRLGHTSTQGWHTCRDLDAAVAKGWKVRGIAATGSQELHVLISRRRWSFRQRKKPFLVQGGYTGSLTDRRPIPPSTGSGVQKAAS